MSKDYFFILPVNLDLAWKEERRCLLQNFLSCSNYQSRNCFLTRKPITETKDALLAILSHAAENLEGIAQAIRELDPLIFSQDRNWRSIIEAPNEVDERFYPIHTTILTKYVKYLYSVEETIGDISLDRRRNIGEDIDVDEDMTFIPSHVENKSEQEHETQNIDEFKRLPSEKEISFKLVPGEKIPLQLASHECRLVATSDTLQFVDSTQTTILGSGLNIVGRGVKSTVKVDGTLKNVSRSYLQIYVGENHTVLLTDLSTTGTFIHSNFLQ
jgi:hypothetical protein